MCRFDFVTAKSSDKRLVPKPKDSSDFEFAIAHRFYTGQSECVIVLAVETSNPLDH